MQVESNTPRDILLITPCGNNITKGREVCNNRGYCHIYPYAQPLLSKEICLCDENFYGDFCSFGPFCSTGAECNPGLICVVFTDNSVYRQECVSLNTLNVGQTTEDPKNQFETTTTTESNTFTTITRKKDGISGSIIALIVTLSVAALVCCCCLFVVGGFYWNRRNKNDDDYYY